MSRAHTCTDVGVRKGWLLAAALLLTACDPLQDYGGLEQQLQAYYRAEQAGDWDKVYALRVHDFRWSVSRDYFVKAMREDARGWALLDYQVLSAETQGDRVQVNLRFRYRVSVDNTDWRQLADNDGTLELEDASLWRYEDGNWQCEDAGMRRHLPMNAPLD